MTTYKAYRLKYFSKEQLDWCEEARELFERMPARLRIGEYGCGLYILNKDYAKQFASMDDVPNGAKFKLLNYYDFY